MTVTIRDVARESGVSPATVSRVLNGRMDVAEELRVRVNRAAERLSYRPNGLARGLRTRTTMVFGAVISDITNPFFTSMVRGIEDTAQAAGYSVVLANSDEDLEKEQRYLQVAAAEQMAGVILSPASSRRTDISVMQRYGIPVVTVDRKLYQPIVNSVTINNRAAAREVTEHLAHQGCRRIAFISGPAGTSTAEERLAGYRSALKILHLDSSADLVCKADYRVEGGYRATLQLLSSKQGRPDGLLVSNNLMALGALKAMEELRIETPGQIAFATFDSTDWTRVLRPSLTVVEQPTYEIGQRAAELLVALVTHPSTPGKDVVLPAKLIVGQH